MAGFVDSLPPLLRETWCDLVDARTNVHHILCGAGGEDDPEDGEDELGQRDTRCTCGVPRTLGEIDAALNTAPARLAG